MGKAGPKKIPTPLLSPDGNHFKYHRKNEVKPQLGEPDCPTFLDRKGRAVWRELAPKLRAAGLLTRIDGGALGRYCEFIVIFRAAVVELRGKPRVVQNRIGVISVNPMVRVAIELSRECARLEACFGMSPADRAGLTAAKGELADEPEHITRLFNPTKTG